MPGNLECHEFHLCRNTYVLYGHLTRKNGKSSFDPKAMRRKQFEVKDYNHSATDVLTYAYTYMKYKELFEIGKIVNKTKCVFD